MRRTIRRPTIVIGVDPGQAIDPPGIVAIQAAPQTNDKPLLNVVHTERLPLGTGYQAIADHVSVIATAANDQGQSTVVALDGTGVGRAVNELLHDRLQPVVGLVSITWTGATNVGGTTANPTVPKGDLLAGIQLVLEHRRLSIPAAAVALTDELLAFKARQTASGQLSGEAGPGAHDDLVAALAVALWVVDRDWRQRAQVKMASAAGILLPRT